MAEELVGHIGSKDASDTADDFLQLVSFRMGHEEFGVDILYVREINRMGEITEAPKLPEYVEGIISLRGRIISIVRLRKRMGLPKKEQIVLRAGFRNRNLAPSALMGTFSDSVSAIPVRKNSWSYRAKQEIFTASLFFRKRAEIGQTQKKAPTSARTLRAGIR